MAMFPFKLPNVWVVLFLSDTSLQTAALKHRLEFWVMQQPANNSNLILTRIFNSRYNTFSPRII